MENNLQKKLTSLTLDLLYLIKQAMVNKLNHDVWRKSCSPLN